MAVITRCAAALCGLGAVLVVTLATPSAAFTRKPHPDGKEGKAAVMAAPRLSIGTDNGQTTAEEGDRFTYTVTVDNIGADRARGLRITQSLPTGLHFVSADGQGRAEAGQVLWTADVPAGEKVVFHTVAEVRDTPQDLLRLATVACASVRTDDRPLVCATHSDRLPAGAAAEAAAHEAAGPVTSRLWYAGAGAGLLALAVLLAFRRTGLRRQPGRSSS
ncbi:hypothetical protein ACFQVD_25485 [Streptosporangium amethystogenes subsp. fukuiense]|uniref:DUF11 domain-containing protein n=1 Tax=Streptosporangium amethystogenes subsp. fukuiense TaxID=698418 RepID=A0ABW2T5Q9_9ACTN